MTVKYIIFGGSGFIGKHFRLALLESHERSEILSLDINPDEDSYFCDVRKPIDLSSFTFSDNLTIINLAAIHKTPGHPNSEYFETNIFGARRVCEFAEQHDIKNIIFANSTFNPYGASRRIEKRDNPSQPNTPYGISKLVAEEIHLRSWSNKSSNKAFDLKTRRVVFGKGENGNFTRLAAEVKEEEVSIPGKKRYHQSKYLC